MPLGTRPISTTRSATRCWLGWGTAPKQQRQQQGTLEASSRGARPRAWRQQPRAALFDPPPFSPHKLRVEHLPGVEGRRLLPRRYTLTHNDLTGTLLLSIGRDYNQRQLAGWYTRAVRDEVLAEWVAGPGGFARLHVYCHVSGEEAWPAPPALRSFIFQREMALVLDTLVHAEAALLEEQPRLRTAPVRLHLRSHLPGLNQAVEWGTLGDRASRPAVSTSLTPVLLGGVQPLAAGSRERRQPRQQHSSVAPLASSRLAVIAAASSQHDSESHS